MGKSTINGHFQWQTVSLPQGIQLLVDFLSLRLSMPGTSTVAMPTLGDGMVRRCCPRCIPSWRCRCDVGWRAVIDGSRMGNGWSIESTAWWWLEHGWIMTFHSYWEFHHPNWRSPSFFRGVGSPHQPESMGIQSRFSSGCGTWMAECHLEMGLSLQNGQKR